MTNRELGATILMLGAECKDLKGKEAKELLTQVEAEITNHIKDQLKNGVSHSVSNSVRQEIERRRDLIISEPDGIVRETMISNLAIDL